MKRSFMKFFAVILMIAMVFTVTACGSQGDSDGPGNSADANETLVALSDTFNGLDIVKQFAGYEGYTFESSVAGDTISLAMGYGEDLTVSDFTLEGDILSADGGLTEENIYPSIVLATAKAVMDGYDEDTATAALSHNSATEMTLEENGILINDDSFQIDMSKTITLKDMSDVYVTLDDLGERDENTTSMLGHAGEISYVMYLSDFGDTVLTVGEPGELTERAYKSLLTLVEYVYGKEAADEFAAQYPEIAEASFGRYTVSIDPENEDYAEMYQQLYDKGNRLLELKVASEG